jgi:hypothetical protein
MATKVMQEPVTWKRFTSDALDTYKGIPGEPVIDFRGSKPELRICDGVTEGGHPVGGGGMTGIAIPQILSPVNGASDVDQSPIITASTFNGIKEDSTADVHAASFWSFYSDVNLSNALHTSGRDTTNLTSYDLSVAGVSFDGGQQVFAKVEYEGENGALAASSTAVFSVIAITEGGLMDGDIVIGQRGGYWLLAAPANKRVLRRWGLYGTDTTLPNNPVPDPNSGVHNTDALTSATYSSVNDGQGSIGAPAAEYCRSLGADYFLPNREDLDLVQQNQAAIDAADPTVTGASAQPTLANIGAGSARDGSNSRSTPWVWSSTEFSSDYARRQRLSDGHESYGSKNYEFWVVPVRRVPV